MITKRLLASLPFLAPGIASCGPPAPGAVVPPRVVLISIDTLRADHLSCYGYERQTSPNIDALARESYRFERTYAQSNHTAPSHMTMLTGLSPDSHGVDHYSDRTLPPDAPYLPKLLKQAGFETAAFGDGAWIAQRLGFRRGFDLFDSRYEHFPDKVQRIESWIRSHSDGSYFLFVHTYGVHAPYLPSEEADVFTSPDYDGPLREYVRPLAERRMTMSRSGNTSGMPALLKAFWRGKRDALEPADVEYAIGLYDGCIRDVDAEIGRLLETLDEQGWLENAWVVLTSDHGEAFGEHNELGHTTIHNPVIRVPLLIRPPGGLGEGEVVRDVARLIDVTPTILVALGIAPPQVMQGEDLLSNATSDSREAFAVDGAKPYLSASIRDGYKLYVRIGTSAALWDLSEDPDESENLLGQEQADELAGEMLESHVQFRARSFALRETLGVSAEATELSSRERDQLRFLGYTGDDE